MDLNDASKFVSLKDMLKAAETGDPLDVAVDAAAVQTADAGLQALADLTDRIRAAQPKSDEPAEALAGALENTELMHALGYAARYREGPLGAALVRLKRAYPDAKADVARLEKAIVARAKQQEEATNKRAAEAAMRHRSRVLGQLTQGLDIKGLRPPPGYEVDGDGVWIQLEGDKRSRVLKAPILIVGRHRDIHTGEVRVDVAWRTRKGWQRHTVPRQLVMDSRAIVKLSGLGAPVSSNDSKQAVKWLSEFEDCNLANLPERATTTHMGWQSDDLFVLGRSSFGGEAQLVAEGGLEALAGGYRVGGTWEGWCDAIARYAARRPLVMLAIYGAACAPLLRILGQPGFVMDWSGETSHGKTSALRAGASAWGVPDDRGDGIILSWASSSAVGPMTVAHFLQSLPLFLDDTKRGKPDVIASTLYDIPAGQERLKGTAEGGLRAIRRWNLPLLSTGEASITSFSQDGGTRARTIVLRGAPFGQDSDRNRQDAEAMREALLEHHGHLGRRLLEYLLDDRTDLEKIRKRFQHVKDTLAKSAKSPVVGRLAAYVAVLQVTMELCEERLGMPPAVATPDSPGPIVLAWRAAQEAATENDPPTEALRQLHAWATANAQRFDGQRTERGAPTQGWAGKWSATRIGFFREVVDEQLAKWGHDVVGVQEAWHRREWTVTSTDRKRRVYRTKVDGRLAWLLTFDLDRDGVPVPLSEHVTTA